MITKIYTFDKDAQGASKSEDADVSLAGSLSYVNVLPLTSELKARQAGQTRGLSTDAEVDFSEKERALWGNSSRFVKTKDGRSVVVMDGKIILEQG